MSPDAPIPPPVSPPPAPPPPPSPDRFPRLNRRLPFSPDRWQLECERFGSAESRPRPPLPPRDAPHPLADAIPLAVRSFRISDALRSAQIADAWPDIVGPNLARLSAPGKIDGTRLFVRLFHPALLAEFRGPLGTRILDLVRQRFPSFKIDRIFPRVE